MVCKTPLVLSQEKKKKSVALYSSFIQLSVSKNGLQIFFVAVGTKFLVSALDKQEVEAYWEIERQKMHKTLNEYILICQQMGVHLFLYLCPSICYINHYLFSSPLTIF